VIRNDIKALGAYHVPDDAGMIKLDAMENPHGMPARLRAAWLKHLGEVGINRYPDAGMDALRRKIAERDDVAAEQVLIGNGSDEIIQMLLMAADAGACVTPAPTFVMYGLISRWLKRPLSTVPLSRDFTLDAKTFLEVCSREKAAIVFLACPNNPTGNMWPEETIRQIAGGFRGLVVIDEAYRPFASRTHTQLIAPNVLILRTFSKLGWAGLRLGYALGDADTITQLNKVRLPYNINALTQASAAFLLDHFQVFEKQAAEICAERARVAAALERINGVAVFPSEANFLLLRVPDADETFAQLMNRGILVKNMHGQDDLLNHCLRVTIGTKKENNQFLAALKEIVA